MTDQYKMKQQGQQIPGLKDDLELIEAMKEMKFIEDPDLDVGSMPAGHSARVAELVLNERKLELIQYFEKAYADTDQDTVVYGPEFVIVVRNILEGKRPMKLRYLTDFEGEEK